MEFESFSRLLVFFSSLTVIIADLSQYNLNHVNLLDDNLLAEYKKSPQVRVVYYYKQDFPRLSGFLKQLDKSAEFLELYGVKVGIYDCSKFTKADICKESRGEKKFFTYNNDRELIQLDLETMFDLNSIMSNILQLVLLREVPILQSKEERIEYEDKYKGKYDIIYGYQKAIGTFEHRIFMEVAYAFQDKFKFAVSTARPSLEGLPDHKSVGDSVVYILRCKEAKSRGDPCSYTQYEESMDLATLAGYIKGLTLPSIFDVPHDGTDIPYNRDGKMHVVYLFYSKDNKEDVMEKAAVISESYRGVFGTVVVDSDSGKSPIEGFNGVTPAAAVVLKNQESAVFMEENFSIQNVYSFVYNQVKTTLEQSTKPKEDEMVLGEGDTEEKAVDVVADDQESTPVDLEEVEEQDDQVAEAVHRARFKEKMDLESVPALTDKTFPKTVQKDLLFVLFYLPFDDKSMAFLRAYVDASMKLENDTDKTLARVDCHDWTDVCGKENVVTYPLIKVYQKGKTLMDYDGMLDTDDVVKTVKLLKHAGHSELKDIQDIHNYMISIFPDGETMPSKTSVLALFDKSHKKELAVLNEVASELKSKIAFGINADGQGKEIAKKQFGTSLPAVIVLKKSDSLEPAAVYKGKFDKMDILQFIADAGLPKMPELSVQLFPALYAKKKPFVVAFLDDLGESQHAKAELEKIVKANKYPDIIFCWLPVRSEKGLGRKILDVYDKSAEVPAISYVNLKETSVYNYGEKFNEAAMMNWLDQIKDGKLEPSTVLPRGEWKPVREGFDFLKMMDTEAKNKKHEPKDLDIENEYGIGFDDEGNEISFDNTSQTLEEEEGGETDAEIRAELLQLRNSRLYHQHDKSKKAHAHHEAELHKHDDMEQQEETYEHEEMHQHENEGLKQEEKHQHREL